MHNYNATNHIRCNVPIWIHARRELKLNRRFTYTHTHFCSLGVSRVCDDLRSDDKHTATFGHPHAPHQCGTNLCNKNHIEASSMQSIFRTLTMSIIVSTSLIISDCQCVWISFGISVLRSVLRSNRKFFVGEHEKWYGLRQGQHGSVATIAYRYNVDDVSVVHRHSLFIVDGYWYWCRVA